MQYLDRIFSFVFSRQMLAFAAMILLALLVWFIGPLLAIDGLRPLAAVGTRVAVIVLLLALGILWLLSGPISAVGVAALCLLVWHGGPLLAMGTAHPLAPAWVRVAIVGGVLLLYAVYGLYVLFQLLRTDQAALTKFLNWGKSKDETVDVKADLRGMNAGIARAMAQLRRLRGRGGLRRLLEGKRYLYELPWYMMVGSPGAGKTTALLNSGLQFPLGREANRQPQSVALRHDGGTLYCDWWFTNDAVLIDTAGRYTVQEDGAKDPAEWRGFLATLRKQRPRAPLNGVLVALGADELLSMREDQLVAHAGMVRDRLAELRQQLGIRFPVYVTVTKLDRLKGFEEYFQALTTEGRSQVWGFTLPLQSAKRARGTDKEQREALRSRIQQELGLLRQRLDAGLRARLIEEYDLDRRQRLYALPQELAGLAAPLSRMVDEIFLDSRFDDTQNHNSLRGVYLTSAAQVGRELAADRHTVMHRLLGLPGQAGSAPAPAAQAAAETAAKTSAGTAREKYANALNAAASRGDQQVRGLQGFFLRDLLSKVVIPEAHLVQPNLRWEWRFRLVRLMGHALALVLFLWVAGALALSFGNNRDYLASIGKRTDALARQVKELHAAAKPQQVPDVLNAARELPGYPGLRLNDPPSSYEWGLYSVPPVLDASQKTYAELQEQLLLPPILRRMEQVLAHSMREGDDKSAYDALRAYRVLHDPQRYQAGGAREVRNWVLADWQQHPEGVTAFGGRASMVTHVDALFSGKQLVQSASVPNEALVREVQGYLNAHTSSQRIYERAKQAMAPEAPADFTLIGAVGQQAGTVFSRAGGAPLEKGVAGLFTYEGYHELFSKRLPEFVGRAVADDAWVMGRTVAPAASAGAAPKALPATDPLLEDVRRRYLNEYAGQWQNFLDSIRLVGANANGDANGADTDSTHAQPAAVQALSTAGANANLGFQLSVLRQLAAPDSPLARLARAVARQTTLSTPLAGAPPAEKGLLAKAADALNSGAQEIGASLNIRPEEQLERELVDKRFAALREVVTGRVDAAPELPGDGGKPGLQNVLGLINEFYTVLVVADTALNAGSLPPSGTEVGSRLALEAGKLPAPFQAILGALATQGAEQVAKGSASILRMQAQQQLDRIMGLLAFQVSEPCKRGVEGRYPFANVAQDAAPDDVAQVFAAGGALDAYFNKYLAPFVDTSVRPWRYKSPDMAGLMVGAENVANGTQPAPATTGPTLLGELLRLLAQGGPSLDSFYRARQIRDALFRSADGKALGWKMDLKVMALDPTVTDLIIDIDGQGERYAHGPVQAFNVSWPGPRGGSTAQIVANPRISNETSTLVEQGPWAVLRLFDKGRVVGTGSSSHTQLEYSFDGRKALVDIGTGSHPHRLNSDTFKGFRCPGRAG